MSRTVRQLMEEQSTELVGRDDELAILGHLLDSDVPLVAFIHGIAGVGKSALVDAFAAEARDRGAAVLRLDSRAIEPIERGFLAALSAATGADLPSAEDAAARLGSLAGRVILVLDTYELLRMLDPWLRQAFVPALTDNVRVVLAGREPPMTGWPGELGGLFRGIPLGSLPSADAEALLWRAGVPQADAVRINRLARGHPLSLRLAASALAERPDVSLDATTVKAIVEGLTELYLAGLDPLTRRALDAAAVIRRPTLSLLEAMLPEAAPQDAFDRLARLPIVELGSDGLILHDTVREAVAALLHASDPDRSRRYRTAAWRQLREEVARATSQEMWRYTADLLFILQNPIVRESFFPTSEHLYSVEASTPQDGPAIAQIVRRYEGAASAGVLETWWRHAPDVFRLARDRAGQVAGFYIVCTLDRITHRLVQGDRVAHRCWEHVRVRPIPRGQRVLIVRIMLSAEHGEAPSPVQAAMWLDLKRYYMELRPNLRRIYSTLRDAATWGPIVAPLGFELLPGDPLEFDGLAYHTAVLDFGPASVDGWLAKVVASELQIEADPILDPEQRQLVLDGRRVDLTRLEFGTLSYLHQRQGKVVARSALLREVWGYDDAGGSNVVEAVVRSLRRKLGGRATSIETVRGIGYRFVPAG